MITGKFKSLAGTVRVNIKANAEGEAEITDMSSLSYKFDIV